MSEDTAKLKPTGLTQFDIDQLIDAFKVPFKSGIDAASIVADRERAISLFKKKLRHKQAFFCINKDRSDIHPVHFIGLVTQTNGVEVPIFQVKQAIEPRANFMQCLIDSNINALDGFYLNKGDAQRALAEYYKGKLHELESKRGCGCKVENRDLFPELE